MAKVLIVDDEPLARDAASELIKLDGHKVWTAEDGETALKMAVDLEPDIMILDVRMPGLDGHTVCQEIRADIRTSMIYVIMLSGKDSISEKIMGLDVGADAYLTKPCEISELKAHIRVGERTALDRHLSMHDALTGLYNRRAFDELLVRELASCRRYGGALSLVTIDLDFFKKVNDNFGHDVGDDVLRELAGIIRTVSRPSDLPCRWGGEEFSWLLPKTELEGARMAAERLRHSIETHDFAKAGQQTASLGVAEFLADEDGEALCRRADLALYEAKETGRNKVVVFQ